MIDGGISPGDRTPTLGSLFKTKKKGAVSLICMFVPYVVQMVVIFVSKDTELAPI